MRIAHPGSWPSRSLHRRDVEADELALTAQKKPFAREHGRAPARIREAGHLPPRDFLDLLRIRFEEAKQPCLAEGEKFSVGKNGRAAPENIWRHLAGAQLR